MCAGRFYIICRMEKEIRRIRYIEPMIHIMVWVIFFGFPFLMMTSRGETDIMNLLHHMVVPVSFCLVFYLNYFIFIPGFLFKGKTRSWILVNVAIVLSIGILMQLLQIILFPVPFGAGPKFRANPGILFMLRDIFSLTVVIGIAASIQLGRRWVKAEDARKEAERLMIEAERVRTEAELKNLRNQLNPHFLLNTLNNIYALITFDTVRAQSAVSQLSKLLGYVLYDNQRKSVPLSKEIEFIRNYISLMKIRFTSDLDLKVDISVPEDSRTEIAPLLFISLIENAFKHGVAPVGKSLVSISVRETPDEVICDTTNTFHPKGRSDRSGSGIGLEQLGRRLDLLYPGRYTWVYGPDPAMELYRSVLTIKK